jgi:hypothetical protein
MRGDSVSGRRLFDDAVSAIERATSQDADLCRPFVRVIEVSGAAVSTLGRTLGSETVCASDARAARLDEIQLDLGEGPCWEALATRQPVLEPDVQHTTNETWPLARQAMHEAGLGAVFAFPLVVAGIDVGAIDLYSHTPQHLSRHQISDATALSRVLARQVLRRALAAAATPQEGDDGWNGRYSRREVHQATGMIIAQMKISPADALLVLRGHAFASGRPVRDIAADVIARELDFSPDNRP